MIHAELLNKNCFTMYRDPDAVANNTKIPVNCTGTPIVQPNSLLNRLLTPLYKGDVVDVEGTLKSISPAKRAPPQGDPDTFCWELSKLPHANAYSNSIV
jgi:hypothetical protein